MANILIVDDDESDLHLMRSILKEAGHETIVASTGEQAMKLYLRKSIDIVVTDIHMPRGDGIELISALRGIDPDSSIVAISGKEPHKLQVAELAGAMVTLQKPVSRDALTAAVTEVAKPKEGTA